ncbi:DUF3080 domain-containing protein [Marinomonas sp. A79]|uniref:DUF3080 domain-containing protein n=1 Tax=Marinomonas vulgaris TaxID=2823372 RepID=A0ABS5H733_9GAMM|nr:DUF3080 family protein [Marinomonas vulgaris]MBR7887513.1 DUF3080 domain-containing protein [Marinomonas vulgaris]
MLIRPFFSWILLCGIILAAMSGCDVRFKAEAVLSQYLTDLNRSALLSLTPEAKVMPVSLPTSRYRQQALTQFDIGLLDFLSLQQCDVGFVAGQKNSILGKVMPDSQRFLYELDIIRAIESCEITDAALSKELAAVAEQKREELPKALGNAVFNGAESEAFFSLSNGFIPLTFSTAEQQELLSSLTRLVDIGLNVQSLPAVPHSVFEEDLKVLMNSEYAGRLLYSLAQLTRYLELVGKGVAALDTQVCGAPMTYLKQQFEVHYVQSIQPYMGRINQSAYQVLPLLNQLADLSSPLSKDMAVFLDQFSLTHADSVWRRYQAASQYHARQWSDLFGRCAVSIYPND